MDLKRKWTILKCFISDIGKFGKGRRNRVYGNILNEKDRYIGPRMMWYDGPIYSVGLWYGHFYYTP